MQYGFTPGPIVLGIILGPIAETNFLQSQMLAQAGDGMLRYMFGGWLNILLVSLCLLSVAYSLYASWQARKTRQRATPDHRVQVHPEANHDAH